MQDVIPTDSVKTYVFRGKRVMLDIDLAEFYDTTSVHLLRQVNENLQRFPSGFMFELNANEIALLESLKVITPMQRLQGIKITAFSAEGVLMAAHLINTGQAIETSIRMVEVLLKVTAYFNMKVF